MNKVHLTRAPEGDRLGWWCAKDPAKPPIRYVSSKWEFLQYDPEERCAKCGLFRDLAARSGDDKPAWMREIK